MAVPHTYPIVTYPGRAFVHGFLVAHNYPFA